MPNAHPSDLFTSGLVQRTQNRTGWRSGNLFMSTGGLEALAKARFMPKPNKPQGYQFRAVITSQSQIFLKLLIRTLKPVSLAQLSHTLCIVIPSLRVLQFKYSSIPLELNCSSFQV